MTWNKMPGQGNKGGQDGPSKEEQQRKKWELKAKQAKRQQEQQQKTASKFPDSKSSTSNASQHYTFKPYHPPPVKPDGGYFCVRLTPSSAADQFFVRGHVFTYYISKREAVEKACIAASELVPEAFQQLLVAQVVVEAIEYHYAMTSPEVTLSYLKAIEPQGAVVDGKSYARQFVAEFVAHTVESVLERKLSPEDKKLWEKIKGSLE